MLISTITQISISGLLAIGLSNNVIISVAIGLVVSASIIIPKLFDKNKKESSIIKDTEINTDYLRSMLSAA
jgi:hypothetical protein